MLMANLVDMLASTAILYDTAAMQRHNSTKNPRGRRKRPGHVAKASTSRGQIIT